MEEILSPAQEMVVEQVVITKQEERIRVARPLVARTLAAKSPAARNLEERNPGARNPGPSLEAGLAATMNLGTGPVSLGTVGSQEIGRTTALHRCLLAPLGGRTKTMEHMMVKITETVLIEAMDRAKNHQVQEEMADLVPGTKPTTNAHPGAGMMIPLLLRHPPLNRLLPVIRRSIRGRSPPKHLLIELLSVLMIM
jgi:hypothetical protein